MPTNDERREVAARLREGQFNGACLVHKDDRAFDYFMELADAAGCGIGSGLENMSLADRLADLIEPEPERTCQMEYDENNSGDELYPTEAYRCSACRWITVDGKPNYCPNCGAKVVGE